MILSFHPINVLSYLTFYLPVKCRHINGHLMFPGYCKSLVEFQFH